MTPLLPVMEVGDFHDVLSGFEPYTIRHALLTANEMHLVIHTRKETGSGTDIPARSSNGTSLAFSS